MLKTAIFAAGTVVGALALPAAVIYIKPVKVMVTRAIGKGAVYLIEKDANIRDILINQGTEFLTYVAVIDEAKKRYGN